MASGFQEETNSNCCDGGVDRISSLPEKAISKILVCLPIKEAVATSKLSTTWRYSWKSIPELVFDKCAYVGEQASDLNFINNVLLLQDGDIAKFEIRDLLEFGSPYVDVWLQFLSTKRLTNLTIEFVHTNSYVCHSCLFYCQALSTLKLKFCRLQLPPRAQFDGLKNLTVLDLEEVNAIKETIEFLVNTSPLLKNLSITQWNSAAISDLKISAPNLRKCVIHGNFDGIITFVKTPELRDTVISLGTFHYFLGRGVVKLQKFSRLDGIVGGLVKIRKAVFFHPIIEDCCNSFIFNSFIFNHLNYLKFKIEFKDPKQVLAALWLCTCSPSLKTVYIDFEPGLSQFEPGLNNLVNVHVISRLQVLYELLEWRKDVLQSLETFELQGFAGSEEELRFIQFFLLNAKVLQTMKIEWKESDTERRIKVRALLKLMKFQRTSSRLNVELPDWEEIIMSN